MGRRGRPNSLACKVIVSVWLVPARRSKALRHIRIGGRIKLRLALALGRALDVREPSFFMRSKLISSAKHQFQVKFIIPATPGQNIDDNAQ